MSANSRSATNHHSHDWRCTQCRKLLGRRCDGRVLIQFARGHRYAGSVPMTAVCRCCGTLNEVSN